jgi:hypothetical protein
MTIAVLDREPPIQAEAVQKALLAFAAGVEAHSASQANAVIDSLAEMADSKATDPGTREVIWQLITVVTPPKCTPRGILGVAFA